MSKRTYQPYEYEIPGDMDPQCTMIIVIPVHNEDHPEWSVHSLMACKIPEDISIEVILVINASVLASSDVKAKNIESFTTLNTLAKASKHPQIAIHIIQENDMPPKKAGVGMARKIGMDVAYQRFLQMGKEDGLIVNLDADCTVSQNYIEALVEWDRRHPNLEGASIYFEHPLGNDERINHSIISYELHLRYFIEVQRYVGLPYAFHTVGSSMLVRSKVYGLVGGMNTRKAGEDFYFLHKIISRGRFNDLNSIAVYPSPRVSDRVPFGTGKAVMDHMASNRYDTTYGFEIFRMLKSDLKSIIQHLEEGNPQLFDLNDWSDTPFKIFLESNDFERKWQEIYQNSKSFHSRLLRFFQWFDAFMLMKYCHFCRDHFGMTDTLEDALAALSASTEDWDLPSVGRQEQLNCLRRIQKGVG